MTKRLSTIMAQLTVSLSLATVRSPDFIVVRHDSEVRAAAGRTEPHSMLGVRPGTFHFLGAPPTSRSAIIN